MASANDTIYSMYIWGLIYYTVMIKTISINLLNEYIKFDGSYCTCSYLVHFASLVPSKNADLFVLELE